MADFDSFDYDIKKRLPEWWKNDTLAMSVNEYTQELIVDMLQALLSSTGVVQPLNCWLTIPEEYNWYHHYKATDDYLEDIYENNVTENAVTKLFQDHNIIAKLPNTKRKCHAKIQLKLLGTELVKNNEGEISDSFKDNEVIKELSIKNAEQEIILKNIPSVCDIEIFTKTGEILINKEVKDDLIEGKIDIIKPSIKDDTYTNLDISDENKKTELIIKSSKSVEFDLQIYLLKPTYTTEQNIRVASVSAFPIEWIRLYGYYCHPFNNKSGYEFLWEKTYSKESRTTYDRITRQYDCERFYIQVKFYGIGVPISKGFPQEEFSSNSIFQPNPNLDKWGKIFGLPRRYYKPDITEEEEPYTFPKYYPYEMEQDYWYEERMVNEYRYDVDAINSLFIKDSDYNNIASLECIYPFMDDIWVYTETINNKSNNNHEINNISYYSITEDKDSPGTEWNNLEQKSFYTILNPKNNETLKQNDSSYQTKKIKVCFCLKEFESEIPDDIIINGIQLRIKTNTDLQTAGIILNTSSNMTLPFFLETSTTPILEKILITDDNTPWTKDKGYYTIGGKNNIFGQNKITKEQLFTGNNQQLEFELSFTNENNFLESILYIEDIKLDIFYEIIPQDYSIDVNFLSKQIDLMEPEDIKMNIVLTNNSDIVIKNKEVFLIIPPELTLKNGYSSFKFNLDVGEVCTIPNILIEPTLYANGPKTGYYDILVFCEDKVIKNEVIIRGKQE